MYCLPPVLMIAYIRWRLPPDPETNNYTGKWACPQSPRAVSVQLWPGRQNGSLLASLVAQWCYDHAVGAVEFAPDAVRQFKKLPVGEKRGNALIVEGEELML